jgi:hypothetical protein
VSEGVRWLFVLLISSGIIDHYCFNFLFIIIIINSLFIEGYTVSHNAAQWSSWLWSYGSWIYNYLCNQYLSSLMLWVQISIRAKCTTLCYKVCQWLATGLWFSTGPLVSSINKTDCHDTIEMHGHDLLDAQFLNNVFYQNHHQSPSGIDNLRWFWQYCLCPLFYFS